MTFTIAILNWNGFSLLQKYLPSVLENTPEEHTITVVDNGSTDDSISLLKSQFPRVEIIELGQNYGFSEGYNRAMAFFKNDWVVLLNSDVRMGPQWAPPLQKFITENPHVQALQPCILDDKDPGKYEYAGAAGGFMDRYFYPFCRGRIMNETETKNPNYASSTPIFWASGACLVIRKSTYETLGGLDTDFFAHMEEIDLCWRILNRYPNSIYCVPQSEVYHYGGATLNSENPRKVYLNFRNSLSMVVKNHPRPLGIIFTRLILDGVAAFKFLIEGKIAFVFSILKAHLHFYVRFPKNWGKRPMDFNLPHEQIYPKSIIKSFFLQGKKRFQDLDWEDK